MTMLLIFDAIESIRTDESLVIMLSPSGEVFKQKIAIDLSHEKHLILLCGHYEGFDERIKTIVDMELSIGDYVLTGGEIPAMAISDSIIRLIDGVIMEDSHVNDSFNMPTDIHSLFNYSVSKLWQNVNIPANSFKELSDIDSDYGTESPAKFIGIIGMILGPIVLIILKNIFSEIIEDGIIKTIDWYLANPEYLMK